jgi:hypothetical protein
MTNVQGADLSTREAPDSGGRHGSRGDLNGVPDKDIPRELWTGRVRDVVPGLKKAAFVRRQMETTDELSPRGE